MQEDSEQVIKAVATEVVERENCVLYDLEFGGRKGERVLRVFVDGKDASVSVDQCAEISRGIGFLLDMKDAVPGGSYELEVSSPGLERQLKEAWHYEKALGQKVKVRTTEGVPHPEKKDLKSRVKQVVGLLEKVTDDSIVVLENEIHWVIDKSIIHKANIVFEFQTAQPKKNSKKKRGK